MRDLEKSVTEVWSAQRGKLGRVGYLVGRENRGQSLVVKVSQRKQCLSCEEQELFYVKILQTVFPKEHVTLATAVTMSLASKKSKIRLRWTNPLTIKVTRGEGFQALHPRNSDSVGLD